MAKYSKAAREESLQSLRENIKPGQTVCTILRSVSSSGMSRAISVVTLENGDVRQWDHAVACVLGESLAKREGVRVSGCGMDMGFHLVYSLSRVLFPDGFGRPMHNADVPDQVKTPATREEASELHSQGWRGRGRNCDESGWDNDGGYALTHRWL